MLMDMEVSPESSHRHFNSTMLILVQLLQVKYGLLSRADASIFMRFPPATYREKIWDHCAGFVIVEEAGGKVSVCSVCSRLGMLVGGGSPCLQASVHAIAVTGRYTGA